MPNLPKFERKVQDKLIQPQQEQEGHPTYGIIMMYDSTRNTATVLASGKGSDAVSDIYHDVPCPTQIGVQGVSPEPGRPCLLVFKDQSQAFPIVSNYFNHAYYEIDYQKQVRADNTTPRFLTGM